MSPTALFGPLYTEYTTVAAGAWQEGCTRGGVGPGWVGEGYTGTQPGPVPRTHISHILRLGPYPRPNEGNIKVIDEVS